MTPHQYCKQKAAASGSSFYYSFLFLTKPKRQAIIALYAFCREVDDIADECKDTSVASIKLAWWRNEIANLYAGKPQHPVTKALAEAIHLYQLDQEHFLEIIDGMSMDLAQNRYADFKQLQLYCYRVASVVGLLSVQIFGFTNRKTLKYAHDLGIALQLTNIIRDVGEDARRNRIYIPLADLEKFNVSVADILNSKNSDKVRALLEYEIERAETFYDKALRALPNEDKKTQRTGLMMAAIYRTLLREIKADDPTLVMNARISLPPMRKFWLTLKTFMRN